MANVLILTASIGNGHNKAAANIYESLSNTGNNVQLVDFLETSSYNMNKFFGNFYKRLIDYKPEIFRLICEIGKNKKLNQVKYIFGKINSTIMKRLVLQYQPDIIICTHFFPLAAAAMYKKDYPHKFKLMGVVTDYNIHPVWQIKGVDKYFIAHAALKEQFAVRINKTNIIATGIPVSTKFKAIKKNKVRNKILIMTSNQSAENMLDIIYIAKKFADILNITFITGNNKDHYNLLQQIFSENKNMVILGYTDKVAIYMKTHDVLITKAGGMTISEAIATGIPLIMYSPIPGMEEENAQFVNDKYLGIWAHTKNDLEQAIVKLFADNILYENIHKNMLDLHIDGAGSIIKNNILLYIYKKNKVA